MHKLLLVLILISSSIHAQYNDGSADKGLTYYKFIFKDELKYNGSVFTGKHTEKEWAKLFENNAKEFKKEFAGITTKLDKFINSKKFEKIAPHIKAFAIHYASDSGYSPHCGNDDIDEE